MNKSKNKSFLSILEFRKLNILYYVYRVKKERIILLLLINKLLMKNFEFFLFKIINLIDY